MITSRKLRHLQHGFIGGLLLLAIAVIASTVCMAPAKAVSGSDWRAGRIIDDAVFYNKSSMNIDQIQQFLSAKVPTCDAWGTQPYGGTTRRGYWEPRGIKFPLTCLKSYQENTSTHENNLEGRGIPGGAKSAANIIWDAAQQYNINPQVLIVTLQKEQALVQDDWPWPVQYRSATGYGCPDSALCDSQYYGFYNQVNNAARQFRLYANNPNNYNHVPGRGNNILFNPNAACGSSNVVIENQATASLYNYTPYQPNQAALNNLYGTGDGCSAYGNRNFWRTFNDWFGASRTGEPMVVKAENSAAQYVLVNNTLYPIPSVDVKLAWGLDSYPTVEMDAGYLGSLPVGGSLTRVTRPGDSPAVYMVDNGWKYHAQTWETLGAWGFSSNDISVLPPELVRILHIGQHLGRTMREPNNGPSMYVMGGATRYHVVTPDTLQAWVANDEVPITVSQSLFDRYTDGAAIDTFKIQSTSGQKFVVNTGYKLPVTDDLATMFPGSFMTLPDATMNSLPIGAVPTNFVMVPNAPQVYVLDNGKKHWVTSPTVLSAWSNDGHPVITYLTQGHINKMTNAADVNSYLASNADASKVYMLDGKKMQIPDSLRQNYLGATQAPIVVGDQLLAAINTGPDVGRYLKVLDQPSIYAPDYGTIKNFPAWQDFALWGGTMDQVTQLHAPVLTQFTLSGSARAYVTDGTNKYMLGQPGVLYAVNAATAKNWALSNPVQLHSTTLAAFTNSGSNLPSSFKIGSKTYMLRDGVGYSSDNADILSIWGLDGPFMSLDGWTNQFFNNQLLTRFATSAEKGDNKIYLVSENAFLHVSGPIQMFNLGYGLENLVNVDAADIDTRTTADWNNAIIKNQAGAYYAIDAGAKRPIADNAVSQWTHNGALSVQTFSSSSLHLLRDGATVTKAIRGSDGPKIYAVENGEKRWIMSYDYFAQHYAPEVNVSSLLIDSLPTGPNY